MLHHVKLHGAFSTHVAEDPAVADGVVRAVHDIDPALPLIVTAASQLERSGAAIGHPTVAEAFPERGYAPGGQLARRGTPGAMITDVDEAARRAVRMAVEGKVDAIDGRRSRSTRARSASTATTRTRRASRPPCERHSRPPGSSWRRSERCAGSASTSVWASASTSRSTS